MIDAETNAREILHHGHTERRKSRVIALALCGPITLYMKNDKDLRRDFSARTPKRPQNITVSTNIVSREGTSASVNRARSGDRP